MTFYELNCYTKVYNAALGYIDRNSVSKEEIKVTIEVLKEFVNEREDWTDEEKEIYKILADYVKKEMGC